MTMKQKKRRRAKSVKAWCIVDTQGRLCSGAVESTKRHASSYLYHGYRLARVKITEIK